ncbi:MAG: N-acetylmuramic acid 6-phosphate etherase [Azospirillaceae bacterium]
MGTESVSSRYRAIDTWPTETVVEALFEAQLAAAAAVGGATGPLARAAEAIAERLRRPESRLVFAGAGASGRIAIQDGVELTPTYSLEPDRIIYLLAGGTPALTRSVEGAEDEAEAAAALIAEHGVGAADVAIGLAASGTTRFTVAAIEAARGRGALTIAMANNAGAPLLDAAEHPILLPTGAEPIAGSTRMKAGTAQKIALNLLTTATMVRLGRVHEGMMVDMKMSNAKLRDRGARIVAELAGVDSARGAAALAAADNEIKTAVLMLRGLGRTEARALIDRADGRLRAALAMTERDTPS